MTDMEITLDTRHVSAMSAEDAASLLFVMHDAGINERDKVTLESWLDSSEENRTAWMRAAGIWNEFEDEPDPLIEAMRRDALMARPKRTWAWRRVSIAASAAAAILIATVGYQRVGLRQGLTRSELASAAPTWRNGSGPPATRTFADGTRITLAPQSVIEIDYGNQFRQVRLLQGRAFFAVAHEAKRPFEVLADGRAIADIGTAFEVASSGGELTVIVSSGRVAVGTPEKQAIELGAGQKLSEGPDQAPIVTQVDVQDASSWRNGFLDLHNMPLADAIAAAESYGGPKLTIDPALSRIRVSGRFRLGDTAQLARALSQIYPIDLTTGPDGAMVLRALSRRRSEARDDNSQKPGTQLER